MPFEGAPWFLLLYFEWGKRWMPAGATEKCARGITYFFDPAVQVIECLAHACQICFEVEWQCSSGMNKCTNYWLRCISPLCNHANRLSADSFGVNRKFLRSL